MDSKKMLKFIPPINAPWKYAGPYSFGNAYKCIINKTFIASIGNTHKIFIPAKKEKVVRCAICLKPKGQVTFKKEAHIIPACLGNGIYFSNEECDACNDRLNNNYDSHFGHMTAPIRGLYQIPNRQGKPKWTYGGGPSQIKFAPENGLAIALGKPNDAVKVQLDDEKHEVRIEGPAIPFQPVKAILSLLHTCWLFFDEANRSKYQDILRILNDELKISPFIFFAGSDPIKNPHLILFEAFGRKVDDPKLPEIVIRLSIGPYLWMWASPNMDENKYLPFPLPEMQIADERHLPSLTIHSLNNYDTTTTNTKQKFTFKFESMSTDTSSIEIGHSMGKQLRAKARLVVMTPQESCQENNLYMELKNPGSSDPFLVFYGPSFAAKIILPLDVNLKTKNAQQIVPVFKGRKPGDVLSTVLILNALSKDGANLVITTFDGKPILDSTVNGNPSNQQDIQMVIKVSSMLVDLENKLKINIKYPDGYLVGELDLLRHLYGLFIVGEDPEISGEIPITLQNDLNETTIEKIEKEKSVMLLQFENREVHLFGSLISIPKHKAFVVKAGILSPLGSNVLKAGTKVTFGYHGLKYIFD